MYSNFAIIIYNTTYYKLYYYILCSNIKSYYFIKNFVKDTEPYQNNKITPKENKNEEIITIYESNIFSYLQSSYEISRNLSYI